jgi:hypothetical protein
MFVALGIQHAMRMRRIVICDPPRSAIFSHIISRTASFSKTGYWIQSVCFDFLYKFFCLTFVILRGFERDMMKKKHLGLHVKYPLLLSDISETWIFLTDFSKTPQISNFMLQWKSNG